MSFRTVRCCASTKFAVLLLCMSLLPSPCHHSDLQQAFAVKASKQASRPPVGFSAAQSHLQNDAYMQRFEKGYEELFGPSPPTRLAEAPLRPPRASSDRIRAVPGAIHGVSTASDACFLRPPADPTGTRLALSERPLLCSAAHTELGELVIGGSDHALYILDAASAKLKRTLFGKASGHTEWVTCAVYTPQGHVVSGGMDSKLCFWRKGSVRSDSLAGHSGPIAALASLASSNTVISASYDKTLCVWDCSGTRPGTKSASTLAGHDAPVLQLCADDVSSAASGDRGGSIVAWDLHHGARKLHVKGAHTGHVTAMCMARDGPWDCLSGGQDGILSAWDVRAKAPAWRVPAHVSNAGRGAVGSIAVLGSGPSSMVVTAGADGWVRVWQPLADPHTPMAGIALPDFPYSLIACSPSSSQAGGATVLCGCGDGSIVAIHAEAGQEAYRLNAGANAVRTMDVFGRGLLASGDDGHVAKFAWQ